MQLLGVSRRVSGAQREEHNLQLPPGRRVSLTAAALRAPFPGALVWSESQVARAP